jgi:hypothetical protein
MTAVAIESSLPVAINTESSKNNNNSNTINTSSHSSNYTETVSTGTSKSDISSSYHHPHMMSNKLHDNLLQTHHEVDPMEFYTIVSVLGEGSMVRSIYTLSVGY